VRVSGEFAAVDAIAAGYTGRGGAPGIAYGIVRDGELVHAGGVGERRLGGAVPESGTVFRIASMSKSFTASAVLLLRDAGALALDDLAEKYVPELASWPETSRGGRVTIRHLLTMTAGFPTDDPWGDRQQGLPLSDFASLLAGGVSVNWAPGTRFEYSNLGYAILGMVVTAASGVPYDEFIRARLLAPIGMTRSGFEAAEFAADGLAQGYRRGLSGWEEVPYDPYGAFAPMGGVFSCVRDLARWVAGFASSFPPGARAEGDHPLAAAARREMQLPQVLIPPGSGYPLPGAPLSGPATYGFGLFIDEDAGLGRVVSHSGGYPGFGSNMRWHPATRTGVIALGNGTYAPMNMLTSLILEALVPKRGTYQVALAPRRAPGGDPAQPQDSQLAGGPWPQTLAAREAVSHLLSAVAEIAAADATPERLFTEELFTENVALDRPYAERLHDIAVLRGRLGAFADSPDRAPEHDTPAHCRWFLAGEGGTVAAQIQLSPQKPPRVMSLTLAIPPAVGTPLARTLDAVVAWLNTGSPSWPESVPVASGADVRLLTRRLRMAAAWTGTVGTGAYRAGDGAASVTVELDGEHAPALLTLLVDPSTGTLRAADATLLFPTHRLAWAYTTWVTNWLDPERLLLVALMLVSLATSAALTDAFGDLGIWVGGAYALMQNGRTAFMVAALPAGPLSRNYQRIQVWCVVSGVLAIAGGLAGARGRCRGTPSPAGSRPGTRPRSSARAARSARAA
jgi:CubicO group peptidase (beta-lactamase class C family)